ncbi:unnamed protein product [Penicillium glandicola]
MDSQHEVARHYAILIGIDAYPCGSLSSCVRDVTKIKQCLEDKLSSVHVRTLTASKSLDPRTLAVIPLETPENWPTYCNVTSAFEEITSQAEPGDFVYIHYSGHGTRLTPCFDFSNQSTGDLALVLLKGDQSPEIYLRGPRLARFVKGMVDKKLIVTLVLDCCFSATVYRHGGTSFRYLPYDLATASASSESPDHEISFTGRDTCSGKRSISMRDNWLLEPDRYAILAACGPDEKAKGGSEKGLTYGALSYFLSRALSDHGLGRRHEEIYRHIRAMFWESSMRQHPVLYGNGDQGFFGPLISHCGVRSISIVKREGNLQLLAGKAHGFRDGDQFTVSPSGWTGGNNAKELKRSIAKVICAKALTSQLELIGPQCNLRTGWIAEPLTWARLASFPIHLAPNLPQRDEWLAALKTRSLSTGTDPHQISALQVVLNNIDEYEILDNLGRKFVNLPAMPREQVNNSHILDVLEHLTRFKMVKDLNNQVPNAAFRVSFDVQIVSDRAVFSPEEQIEVRHNSIMEVSIINKGDIALYAHMYNLDSCWRVKGMLFATYETIPPRKNTCNGDLPYMGRVSKKIKMTVPPMMKEVAQSSWAGGYDCWGEDEEF